MNRKHALMMRLTTIGMMRGFYFYYEYCLQKIKLFIRVACYTEKKVSGS